MSILFETLCASSIWVSVSFHSLWKFSTIMSSSKLSAPFSFLFLDTSNACRMGPPKTDLSSWRGLTECGPLEKGVANHFSILALKTPWTVWKDRKDRIVKGELPRSIGAQYATGDQWTNNSRKKEEMEPNQKQYPVVDGTGDRSKVWCCKEQYCIGTWNVRSMNQGKLEVVKQEMARVNVDILGIIKLKWTGMGEINSDDHYIYYYGQESLRRNGVVITVNKRIQNAVLGCHLKNNRMISVHFQGKPFNIMVI